MIDIGMTNLRRYFRPGDISFLTHVTYGRQPILIKHFELLWTSIDRYKLEKTFDLLSWVVLPDHFHIIIDPRNNNVSDLMKSIKISFSIKYKKLTGNTGRVWQNRFWDHIIRNDRDLNNHLDYIHYNPVKHGFVHSPGDWKFSSFQDYLKEGLYSPDWGTKEPLNFDGQYGE